MKDNLFDFGDEKIDASQIKNNEKYNEKEMEEQCANKGVDVNEAKNLYEKYKNYSTQDLLSEFYNVINTGKQNGTLTDDKINKTIEGLKPFLNENQKQFLNTIFLRGE